MTNNTQATTSSNAGIERCEKLPTNLERDSAYHGFITQTMAETNVRKAGDYVVWGEEKENAFAFHLTVRVDVERVKHYRLVSAIRDGQLKWSIDGMVKPPDLWFVEIPELLKSLKKTEGICTANEQIPTKMTRAAKRPHDLIRNRNIRITSKHRVGEGNFCVITEGQLNWAPGITRQVAIKAFKELASDATFDQIIKEQKDMLREIRIMSTLSHVNVVNFYGIACDLPPIKIVMEFCGGGSLLDHLKKQGDRISVGERLLYSFETARGMYYLETKSIIHRDLAARNCLIATESTIKIADFGLSISSKDIANEVISRDFRVPIRQMAPETIGRHPIFSHKSDVWSYGILLWEVFNNGKKPWEDLEVKEIVNNIKELRLPKFSGMTPTQIIALVGDCWYMEPSKRATFGQITEITSKLVQDPKFSLPPPSKRTLVNNKTVHPRSADNFTVNLRSQSPHRRGVTHRTKTHDDTSDDRRTKTKYKTLQSRGQSITTHSNFSPKDSVADHSRQRKVELGEAKNGKKPKTLGQSNKTLD